MASASISARSLMILTQDDQVTGPEFEREPESYTVEQLKHWLKCRGLKQSGERDELVEITISSTRLRKMVSCKGYQGEQ